MNDCLRFRCIDCDEAVPFQERCPACGCGAFEPADRLAWPLARVTHEAPMNLLIRTLSVLHTNPRRRLPANGDLQGWQQNRAMLQRSRALLASGRALAEASRAAIADTRRMLRMLP